MKMILKQIAEPLLRRVGSFTAAFLAANNVPSDTIEAIQLGIVAAGLISVDLLLSKYWPGRN